jgi:hypothetical protein
MSTLKKIGRALIILIAVLVIVLSAAGIYGAWYANRTLTDVTLKVFTVVDTGVTIAQTGVTRVDSLVQDGRTEVQQAEQTIENVGANLQENSPVLNALNSRLETRLAPTVGQIQTTLAPVRESLATVANVVEIANSIPFVETKAPRMARLDEIFNQLGQLAADIKQLNDTLRASVVEGKNQLTQEAVTTLTGITTRVDTGLGAVQTETQAALVEIQAFQEETQALKSRLLLYYNLTALALTLFLLWVVYSQIVLIRYQWAKFGKQGTDKPTSAPEQVAVVAAPVVAAQEPTTAAALQDVPVVAAQEPATDVVPQDAPSS